MFCEECGSQIADGSQFCPVCGARIEDTPETAAAASGSGDAPEMTAAAPDTMETPQWQPEAGETPQWQPSPQYQGEETRFCGNCGAQIAADSAVCPFCGQRVGKTVKKMSLPALIGGSVACVVVLAVLFCLFASIMRGGGSSNSDRLLYLKDSSLMMTSLRKLEPTELDDDATDDEEYSSFMLQCRYTSDNKYLIYPEIEDGKISRLCFIDVKKKDAEPEKIDSDIDGFAFTITADDKVVYKKNDTLYVHDLEDKEKIASDVSEYRVAQDGSGVVWRSQDDENLYWRSLSSDGEKEKLDSEIDSIYAVSDSLDNILYRKEGALYLVSDFGDKEKIASDINEVVAADLSDQDIAVYYTKLSDNEISLMDFVNDDLADEDAKIEEPDEADYQTERTVESWFGSRTVTETSDEYYEELDKYEAKQTRDRMREYLSEQTTDTLNMSLLVYKESTGESETMMEGLMEDFQTVRLDDGCVGAFRYLSMEDVPQMKFSDIVEDADQTVEDWKEDMQESGQRMFFMGNRLEAMSGEDSFTLQDFYLYADAEKNIVYALVSEYSGDDSDPEEYELGTVSVDEKSFAQYEKLYDDVAEVVACQDGSVCYMQDMNDSDYSGDLYLNDERIAYDVCPNYVSMQDGNILYFEDLDDDYCGTMKLYNGKESVKISDDAATYSYEYFAEDSIAFLTDISSKSGKGDLKLYNGKESETVDTDVYMIIPAY